MPNSVKVLLTTLVCFLFQPFSHAQLPYQVNSEEEELKQTVFTHAGIFSIVQIGINYELRSFDFETEREYTQYFSPNQNIIFTDSGFVHISPITNGYRVNKINHQLNTVQSISIATDSLVYNYQNYSNFEFEIPQSICLNFYLYGSTRSMAFNLDVATFQLDTLIQSNTHKYVYLNSLNDQHFFKTTTSDQTTLFCYQSQLDSLTTYNNSQVESVLLFQDSILLVENSQNENLNINLKNQRILENCPRNTSRNKMKVLKSGQYLIGLENEYIKKYNLNTFEYSTLTLPGHTMSNIKSTIMLNSAFYTLKSPVTGFEVGYFKDDQFHFCPETHLGQRSSIAPISHYFLNDINYLINQEGNFFMPITNGDNNYYYWTEMGEQTARPIQKITAPYLPFKSVQFKNKVYYAYKVGQEVYIDQFDISNTEQQALDSLFISYEMSNERFALTDSISTILRGDMHINQNIINDVDTDNKILTYSQEGSNGNPYYELFKESLELNPNEHLQYEHSGGQINITNLDKNLNPTWNLRLNCKDQPLIGHPVVDENYVYTVVGFDQYLSIPHTTPLMTVGNNHESQLGFVKIDKKSGEPVALQSHIDLQINFKSSRVHSFLHHNEWNLLIFGKLTISGVEQPTNSLHHFILDDQLNIKHHEIVKTFDYYPNHFQFVNAEQPEFIYQADDGFYKYYFDLTSRSVHLDVSTQFPYPLLQFQQMGNSQYAICLVDHNFKFPPYDFDVEEISYYLLKFENFRVNKILKLGLRPNLLQVADQQVYLYLENTLYAFDANLDYQNEVQFVFSPKNIVSSQQGILLSGVMRGWQLYWEDEVDLKFPHFTVENQPAQAHFLHFDNFVERTSPFEMVEASTLRAEENTVSVFPQPAKNSAYFSVPNGMYNTEYTIELYTIDGRLLYRLSSTYVLNTPINLTQVERGNYIVKIKSPDKEYIGKLIVQ